MAFSVGGKLLDSVLSIGMEAGINKYRDKIDKHKLKFQMEQYISRQRKYNKLCTLSEEIDFQGLSEYITTSLIDDANKYIFGTSKTERSKGWKTIIDSAAAYSHAQNTAARKRVEKFVGNELKIIKSFYERGIRKSDLILAAKVTGAVSEKIDNSNEDMLEKIKEIAADTLRNSSSLSIEAAFRLAGEMDFSGFNEQIALRMQAASRQHPLYPDFGYGIQDDMIVSRPLSADAIKKYQPNIKISGNLTIGGKPWETSIQDPIDYADRHQLPLSIAIIEATKRLGNYDDTIQTEAEELTGKTLTRNPTPFPPAIPCQIKLDDTLYYDYILLRIQEIMDDSTIVVSNREQENCSVSVALSLTKSGSVAFQIQQRNPNNHELLNFRKMIKHATNGSKLVIFDLSERKEAISGALNSSDFVSDFETLEQEINFLEMVCLVEDHYRRQIKIPDSIYESDYETLTFLSDLIKGKEVALKPYEQNLTGTANADFSAALNSLDGQPFELAMTGKTSVSFWGEEFGYLFMRRFTGYILKDLDALKRLIRESEVGDPIQISVLPTDGATVCDKMITEEERELFRIKAGKWKCSEKCISNPDHHNYLG